jgi:hypothetical protein
MRLDFIFCPRESVSDRESVAVVYMSEGASPVARDVLRCFSTTVQSCPTSRDIVTFRLARLPTLDLSHTT